MPKMTSSAVMLVPCYLYQIPSTDTKSSEVFQWPEGMVPVDFEMVEPLKGL